MRAAFALDYERRLACLAVARDRLNTKDEVRLRGCAATARQPSHLITSEGWCERGDSNPHVLANASPSSWCVCQFRHFRKEGWAGSWPETEPSL